MSRSGRKHNSKWDLKEVSPLPFENIQVDDWPQRAGMSFRDKEFQPGWLSPEVGGRNSSKWSIMAANNMLKSEHDLHLPSREPLLGSRGSHRDDSINENRSKNLKSTIAWDADGSYDTNMSPGLDEWRQQNHSRSPKNGWRRLRRSRSRSRSWSRSWSRSKSRSRSRSRNRSRSRSRSPVRDFRRESGGYDSSRSRSRVSGQLCRDFAAGRCRRGNHCQFLHEGKHNYEDRLDSRHKNAGASKYSSPHDMRGYPVRSGRSTELCHNFQKGNCRRGEFCKYVHDGAADGFDIGSANEVDRERENERRNVDASYERGGERVIRRSGDIPCKYFAVGNCRNGNHCRFSHHSQLRASPNRRSHDDWRGPGCNSDSLEPVWGDTNTAGHNLADVEQSQDGRKWSDTNKAAKLSEEKNGEMGAPDPRFTSWCMDDRWAHSSDNENIARGDPTVSHIVVENGEKEVVRRKTENAGASMGLSGSGGAEKWPGDTERSPLWDYRMQSSNHVVKEGPSHIAQNSQSLTLNDTSLHTYQQDITREASGQMCDPAAITQPVIIEKSYFQQNNLKEDGAITFSGNEKNANSCIDLNYSANILPGQSFNQNGQSSSAFPLSSSNAVGQSQKEFLTEPPRGGSIKDPQTQVPFQEGQSSKKPDIGDSITSQLNSGILPSQKMVSSEQLSQLTNLSASLAQLFGNGQQLPQLYAALNSHNATDVPSFTNSEDLVGQVSTVLTQRNPVINPQKQYDPICDNLEQKKPYTSGHAPGIVSNSIGQRHITDGNAEIPSKNFSPSSFAGGPNDGDKTGSINNELNHKSQLLNQPDSGVNQEGIKVNNGVVAEESKKPQEENKDTQDNDQLENMDEDRRADEGKKGKDVKGIRAFKFALVEFVKELLKPAWKESQVNKDAYKTIVKKVVDKVTGAIQGANIPQTQEKIDHYLSCSKPKLTKLVQAYVEKFQKAG